LDASDGAIAAASSSLDGRGLAAIVLQTRAAVSSAQPTRAALTLKLLAPLGQRHLVPLDDLGRVKAHGEEVLGALEQLAGEDEDEVGGVAHLALLRVRRHDEQLGGGVRHLDLADNRRRVIRHKQPPEVVDD
jgi:hypothetical protein